MSTTPIQLPALEPPKYYSPLDARAKLMNLQNLAQQQQIGQQQLQVGQLNMEAHQRDLAQQQAINQAHKDAWIIGADGKPQFDKGKFTQALVLSNHGSAIPGIMEGYTKYEKSLADLGKVKGEVAAAEQNAAGAFGAAAQSADNDPHVFLNLMKSAVNNEALTEDHVKPFVDDVTAALGYDPSGQVARGLVKKYTDLMIAGSPKQQELATAKRTSESTVTRNTAQGKLADVNSLQKRMEIAAQTMPPADPQTGIIDPQKYTEWRSGLDPDVQAKTPPALSSPVAGAILKRNLGLTVEQQRLADQAKAALEEQKVRDAQTERHAGVLESQGQARIGIERQNAARMQKQFDATYGAMLGPNGEQLSPEAMKAMAMQDPAAVGVANYQLPPPNAGRGGPGAATLRKVMAINPTYNAQNWQSQAAMMKGYTSGSQSKEISGINTALGHVAALGEAIDALKNTDVQALNRIANYFGVQTGGDAVTTFKAIVHKVAPEINRAYVGGVGSQGEIQSQESDFDPKLGDKQLRSNVGITAKLLRSKIGSLENQWKQTMGSDFNARFMMPEAQRAIEKWAPEGGGAPSGGRSGAATPSLPATLSQSDVGKVYTSPRTGKRIKITAVNPQNPKQFQSQEVP